MSQAWLGSTTWGMQIERDKDVWPYLYFVLSELSISWNRDGKVWRWGVQQKWKVQRNSTDLTFLIFYFKILHFIMWQFKICFCVLHFSLNTEGLIQRNMRGKLWTAFVQPLYFCVINNCKPKLFSSIWTSLIVSHKFQPLLYPHPSSHLSASILIAHIISILWNSQQYW